MRCGAVLGRARNRRHYTKGERLLLQSEDRRRRCLCCVGKNEEECWLDYEPQGKYRVGEDT